MSVAFAITLIAVAIWFIVWAIGAVLLIPVLAWYLLKGAAWYVKASA